MNSPNSARGAVLIYRWLNRLGEAKSTWCLSPSGKQYLPLSPLFPKAGRPREEVKTTVVGALLCALIVLHSLLGMGVSRPLWPDLPFHRLKKKLRLRLTGALAEIMSGGRSEPGS